MMKNCFCTGMGRAEIHFEQECLPCDHFSAVRDPLYVRVLMMEQSVRTAIVAVDLTSMFDETIADYRQILQHDAGVEPENCWISVTHTFSAPHLWHTPAPGETEIPAPGHKARTSEEISRGAAVTSAYRSALKKAVAAAVSSMQPAVCGAAYGKCGVAASRNMETKDGWWLGCDENEFTDPTVTVLRFDTPQGKPIGSLFVYGCQNSVLGMSQLADGTKVMSSDLAGKACRYVEQSYSSDYICLSLCGAAGDQEPRFKARYNYVDKDGTLHTADRGEQGFVLLDAQSERLGAEVLKTARAIQCRAPSAFLTRCHAFTFRAKKMTHNIHELHPVRSCAWEPDGEKTLNVYALCIGELALIGVQPELGARTSADLRNASPWPLTAVVTMVNGGAKYLMPAADYDRCTYGAQNSPFQKGAAEQLLKDCLSLLQEIKKK